MEEFQQLLMNLLGGMVGQDTSGEEHSQFMDEFRKGFLTGMSASSQYQDSQRSSEDEKPLSPLLSFLLDPSRPAVFLLVGMRESPIPSSAHHHQRMVSVPPRSLPDPRRRCSAHSLPVLPRDPCAGGAFEQRSWGHRLGADSAERGFQNRGWRRDLGVRGLAPLHGPQLHALPLLHGSH